MSLVRYGRYCLRDPESYGHLFSFKERMSCLSRSTTEAKFIKREWRGNLKEPSIEKEFLYDNNVNELSSVVSKPRLLQKVVNGVKGLFKKR